MKRILIVNVNWLGDTLFVTPFIRALRENYPDGHIAVLTHPRCKDVLENNPHINELIFFNEKRGFFNILSKMSVIKSKRFDTGFILRPSFSRTLLLYLSGIPERIGYDDKRSSTLLTKKIKADPTPLHKIEYFLGIARGMGIEPRSKDYEFFVTDKDRSGGDKLLISSGVEAGEDFIVINPGGNWDLKRWPKKNFARLGDEIQNRLKIKVILTGAEKDKRLCEDISRIMNTKPVVLCGKTSLKTLGAVFERARCVISNDSGPMHIASAVKTKTIGLFGPTDPSITGPHGNNKDKIIKKDIDCKTPCYKLDCDDNRCMKAITVDDVLEAII
ncbi:MAG: lipopolysaccharide heptosyltransferase II [Candidatus Omnitrophota bacterium]